MATAGIKTVKVLENVIAGLMDWSTLMYVSVAIARIMTTVNRNDLLTFSK